MENSHINNQTHCRQKSMKFLKLKDVIERVGLKHSTIYKRVLEGKFPRPVQLGGRAVAWVECEVEAWMQTCVKERRNLINHSIVEKDES